MRGSCCESEPPWVVVDFHIDDNRAKAGRRCGWYRRGAGVNRTMRPIVGLEADDHLGTVIFGVERSQAESARHGQPEPGGTDRPASGGVAPQSLLRRKLAVME